MTVYDHFLCPCEGFKNVIAPVLFRIFSSHPVALKSVLKISFCYLSLLPGITP